jgi:hypothetical protein
MSDSIEVRSKKATHRSPSYPFFNLEAAVDKIRRVYENERRSATTPSVIAQCLGYRHTDGPGGRTISCLRQYGLLEQVADNWKVSDAAFNILHLPDDDSERTRLLKAAATKPALYRQLREDYPEALPSDATLKANLVRREFNPDVLDWVVGEFRATMEFAKVYDGVKDGAEVVSAALVSPSIDLHIDPAPRSVNQKLYEYAFAGYGRAELRIVGEYTLEDIADLESLLKTTINSLKRSINAQQSEKEIPPMLRENRSPLNTPAR